MELEGKQTNGSARIYLVEVNLSQKVHHFADETNLFMKGESLKKLKK